MQRRHRLHGSDYKKSDYSLLKHQMLKLNIRRNYMTVPAAIVELNKLEMVKVGQGDYQLHHTITKTQKTILSSFGISLEDVQVYANQIARILKTNAKEAELEDEDYEDGESAMMRTKTLKSRIN
ncbi:MAG: hypothetical protein V8T56_01610 [Parasutterella sp.]|uniref:hypothetical protein n=1 Tax=Parasutterella sp. TaxID=2049037 RepID=UPI00300F124C